MVWSNKLENGTCILFSPSAVGSGSPVSPKKRKAGKRPWRQCVLMPLHPLVMTAEYYFRGGAWPLTLVEGSGGALDNGVERTSEPMKKDRAVTETQCTGPHRFQMEGWIRCAPFERLLNMEILEAVDGRAVLTMPFYVDYAQGAGLMHGGALVSLADTATVMAIKSIIEPLSHFATILLEAKFHAPIRQGMVTAKARVVHREGRTLKGRAEIRDAEGRVVMEVTSTFRIARDATIRDVIFAEEGA